MSFDAAALASLTDPLVSELRERLVGAGYDAGVLGAAEAAIPGFLRAARLPLLQAWCARNTARATGIAARLLAFAGAVRREEASSVLGDSVLGALLCAGVLETRGDGIVSRAELRASTSGGFVLCDLPGGGRDTVMGPSPGTELLGRLLDPDLAGRSVLDLGCGAGTLALCAAARGARATATDVNPRALELTRFNARLNGVLVEVLEGNLFEPVRHRLFDRVVCQPPFVARPPTVQQETRAHGGLWGDELAFATMREAPAALAPGGRALLLVQSPVREDASFVSRLRDTMGDAPVERLVLTTDAPSPALQSMAFAASAEPALDGRYGELATAYLEHFAQLGVSRFGGALVSLSRSEGDARPGGRYMLSVAQDDAELGYEGFARYLEGLELLLADDETLAGSRLRVPAGSRMVLEETPAPKRSVRRWLPAPRSVGSSWELSADGHATLLAISEAPRVSTAAKALARTRRTLPEKLLPEVLAFAREALIRGALGRSG